MIPTEVIGEYQRQAELGDKFKEFERFGMLGEVEKNILQVIEDEALTVFKSVLPEETTRVAEAQMMYNLAERFRVAWKAVITTGDYAREQLKALPKENSDEREDY